MYSLTNPQFSKRDLAGRPAGMRTWMTVRNDDIYSFRWGDPEFARAYLRAMPGPDVLAGFYNEAIRIYLGARVHQHRA